MQRLLNPNGSANRRPALGDYYAIAHRTLIRLHLVSRLVRSFEAFESLMSYMNCSMNSVHNTNEYLQVAHSESIDRFVR